MLNSSSHEDASNFFNLMSSNYLLPLITFPTRIYPVNDTLINNIFTNQFSYDFVTGNLTTGLSDHLPCFAIVPNSNVNHLPKVHNLYKRDSKNLDKVKFLQEVKSINWQVLEIDKDRKIMLRSSNRS